MIEAICRKRQLSLAFKRRGSVHVVLRGTILLFGSFQKSVKVLLIASEHKVDSG